MSSVYMNLDNQQVFVSVNDSTSSGVQLITSSTNSHGQNPVVNQESTQGLPPTYEEASNRNDAPPSYESLFGQMREVRQNSSGNLDFLQKVIAFILDTFSCTVIVGVSMIIPITMIVVGSLYLHDCPAEDYIPIFLIVGGVFGCLRNTMNLLSRYNNRSADDIGRRLRQTPDDAAISFFMLVWFIAGCVWIYGIYQPEYKDVTAANYCNRNLYLFSFWLITTVYVILGMVTSCICCISIASCTILLE